MYCIHSSKNLGPTGQKHACFILSKFCYCSCKKGTSEEEGDLLASHMTIEQLQERDQLLASQNEILKVGNLFTLSSFSHLQLEDRLLF